mgnify:CR=1 FL=1
MTLFIGPKLEYVWKHKTDEEFEGFGHSGIKEELRPINIKFRYRIRREYCKYILRFPV